MVHDGRIAVIAVRRPHETASMRDVQMALTHHPRNPSVVDPVAKMAELKGNTTIAIARNFVMDVANQVYQPVN